MTTQEAKQVLDWIAEGKCEYEYGGWIPYPTNKLGSWSLNAGEQFSKYRRAPEPKLRPWKPEEAIGKAIRHKSTGDISIIECYSAKRQAFRDQFPYEVSGDCRGAEWYLNNCEQLDGSPCGVQE